VLETRQKEPEAERRRRLSKYWQKLRDDYELRLMLKATGSGIADRGMEATFKTAKK
jgi:hypothetical protein